MHIIIYYNCEVLLTYLALSVEVRMLLPGCLNWLQPLNGRTGRFGLVANGYLKLLPSAKVMGVVMQLHHHYQLRHTYT